MPESDELLIVRCQKGDTEAFDELFNRYKSKIFTFIYQFVKDVETAEDIFQETFIRVFTKAKYFSHKSKFSTWLYTIAGNLCRDELKRRKRKQKISLESPIKHREERKQVSKLIQTIRDESRDARRQIQRDEFREILLTAIDELPEKLQIVINLHGLHQLKYREVAKILRCPVGTVQSRMHNALKLLKKKFQEKLRKQDI